MDNDATSAGLTPEDALNYRYEILNKVGSGGMGIVYRARDRETGATVAVKVLHSDIANRPEVIDRFKTELVLARKITHKNVCRVYDLNRFGDTVSISMEYVEGESLRTVLERVEGLSIRHGLKIAGQIIAGLAEAHAQGVIHRDLKPENILIARDGTVKVMDFGIARAADIDATLTGTIVGTPAYMSPEQASGKTVDRRSDIYSLGLVMYEMFCGRRAFTGDTPIAVAMKQIQETPFRPTEIDAYIPALVEQAILKCIEKNPAKRFQSVAELESALAPKAEPIVATGDANVQLPVHLTRWQRSDWLLIVFAGLGLLLFFPFFQRTSLAPKSMISFDRSVLGRIARDYAEKIGAPLGQLSDLGIVPLESRYNYVASHAGAPAARDLSDNPVPYRLWRVDWDNGTAIEVDNRGSLQNFSRNFAPGSFVENPSIDDAKAVAEKALRDWLHADPTTLHVETSGDTIWRGQSVTAFTWSDPMDYYGIRRQLIVRLVGREIASLESNFILPPGFQRVDFFGQLLPVLGFDLALLVVGFAQWRRVNLRSRWRIVTIVLAALMGLLSPGFIMPEGSPLAKVFVSVLLGLSTVVIAFFVLVPVEIAVRRFAPAKISTIERLFHRSALSEPCGLAVLRGTLAGLVLLGVDTFLVWFGTSHLGMWLESGALILMPVPKLMNYNPVTAAALAIFQTVVTTILIAFLASLFSRIVQRVWAGLFLAAIFAALIFPGPLFAMGAVEPYLSKVLLLYLDFLLLGWIFIRFDTLTLAATAFTFAFVADNYALFVTYSPTGSSEERLLFVAWGCIVAIAAAVAFKSSLLAAFRRLAIAFQ